MHLQIEFFGKRFLTMGAHELGHTEMYHLGVLVQVALLRELHVAVATLEWALSGVGPQVIKVLAHGENRELACPLGVFMLALE